jgi:hypothetical protein
LATEVSDVEAIARELNANCMLAFAKQLAQRVDEIGQLKLRKRKLRHGIPVAAV